jgi:hypothetical protein
MPPDHETHEYVYELKAIATVQICAATRDEAERVLLLFTERMALDCPKQQAASARVVSASIEVDDVDFPFLVSYDGVDTPFDDPDNA